MNYFLAAFKKYAVFTGRARRKEFWYFYLFLVIFIVVFSALISVSTAFTIFYGLAWLVLICPYLAVGVRRMHDVDKSGWFLLIPIYSLILLFTDGTPGPNRFGPDPKRPEFEDFLSEKTDPVQTI